MRVSSDMPDDVIVLHDALEQLQDYKNHKSPLVLHLKNCGTALRFLQVHLAQCYPNEPITLTGDPRLLERDGKPTSQTTSALILHGIDVPVSPEESPYITMTRKVMENYQIFKSLNLQIESCWSSASYWYEYLAIHGGELVLEGLKEKSIQGDRIVADIYAKYFGVTTTFTPEGAILQAHPILQRSGLTAKRSYSEAITIDFINCIDLYPAVALTCERLGITLQARGTERLRYKESDRLEAVRLHQVRNDHRIAMALLAADYPVSADDQACIAKSYPEFAVQLSAISTQSRKKDEKRTKKGRKKKEEKENICYEHITPIKGVNDDNLGKKHALSKLIHAATADYLWLHDDDVILPSAAKEPNLTFPEGKEQNADLIILPLRMESSLPEGRDGVGLSLLERLQIAEYAAIQELTMRTAKRGHAVMCSGANLIVRREVWLACENELHKEIPSGDDMFLLEAVKRHGYRIGVIDAPEYTAVVRPISTWRAFFRQRMRWAGKAPHYTDRDIRRCGAFIVLANVLQVLCPPVILIKFPIEYSLIRSRQSITNNQSPITNFLVALLLEILYPFYLLVCLIGGLCRPHTW